MNSLRVGSPLSFIPASPLMDAVQVAAQAQIMHAALVDLALASPPLAEATRAFLGQQGLALPSALGLPGANPFAALSAMDPRALAALAPPPDVLASEGAFSSAEVAANLDATYGPGSAALVAQTEQAVQQAQLALLGALHGAPPDQVAALFGSNRPGSGALAERLTELAQLMLDPASAPRELQAASQAVDLALLRMMAGENKGQAKKLREIFRQHYGVNRPGNGFPLGGGAVGNVVGSQRRGALDPPAGAFVTPNASQAGLKALDAARSQVGVREATGNNDGIPSQRFMNGRQEPWCANFVAWSFRQTGHPLPGNQRSLASVQYMEDQMKGAGKYIPRGQGTPKPGDIIFFANRGDSDRGGGRHVGIVEKVVNGRVYTIEGNSGNQVARRSYPLNLSRIAGYGRP